MVDDRRKRQAWDFGKQDLLQLLKTVKEMWLSWSNEFTRLNLHLFARSSGMH